MLKPVKVEKLIKFLEREGFVLARQKGSHAVFKKGSKLIVIPIHRGKAIKKSLLRLIISQLGMSVEEFFRKLQ